MSLLEEKLKKITTILKRFFSRSGYGRTIINPSKDWQRILFFSAIVLLGCSIFAGYFYFAVSNNLLWKPSMENKTNVVYTINQKNLNAVSDYFAKKENNIKNLQSDFNPPKDPSL